MTKPLTEFPVAPCRNCSKSFPRTRNDKVFCCNKCRYLWHYSRRQAAMAFAYKEGII